MKCTVQAPHHNGTSVPENKLMTSVVTGSPLTCASECVSCISMPLCITRVMDSVNSMLALLEAVLPVGSILRLPLFAGASKTSPSVHCSIQTGTKP